MQKGSNAKMGSVNTPTAYIQNSILKLLLSSTTRGMANTKYLRIFQTGDNSVVVVMVGG